MPGDEGAGRADQRPTGEYLRRTTRSAVLASGVWSLALYLVPQVFTVVISVVAARVLGPEDFGQQSFIGFVALSTAALLGGGIQVSLARYVGELLGRQDSPAARGLVAWLTPWVGIASVLGCAVPVAVAAAGAEPRAAWVLAGLVSGLGVAYAVPNGTLVGLQRWRSIASIGLVVGLVATIVTIVVLILGGGVTGMFAVEAVAALSLLLWTGAVARRELRRLPGHVRPSVDLRRQVTRFLWLTSAGIFLSLIVWRRSEFIFLERYSGTAELALYAIPFALVAALLQIPAALSGVLGPVLATLHGAGAAARIESGFWRASRLTLALSLPIAALTAALGAAAIRLVYGDEYSEAGDVLVILVSGFPLIALGSVGLALLAGLGLAAAPLAIAAVGALVNVGLDVALIPDGGATGAAIANTVAQGFASLLIVLYAGRLVGPARIHAWVLARAAAAAAAAGVVGYFANGAVGGWAGLLVGLAVGLACFAAIGLLMGVLSRDDADWLARAAGARFGGRLGSACRLLGGMASLRGEQSSAADSEPAPSTSNEP